MTDYYLAGKQPDPDRKLWKDIMAEAMAQGRIPVPRSVTVDPKIANWKPDVTTSNAWQFEHNVKFRKMYWLAHNGQSPNGMTQEEWMRAYMPDMYNKPQKELPYGAIGLDAYGLPKYGGTSRYDEFVKRQDAQLEDARRQNVEGGWNPDFKYTNPMAAFTGENKDVNPDSIEGIGIAAKHIVTQNFGEVMHNLGEVGQGVFDYVSGKVYGTDPEKAYQSRKWWLDNIKKPAANLGMKIEDTFRLGVSIVSTALWRSATGKKLTELDKEAIVDTKYAPNRSKYVGDNPYMAMMAEADAATMIKNWFDTGWWKETYREAKMMAPALYGNLWDGISSFWDPTKRNNENSYRLAEMVRYANEHPESDWYAFSRDINNPVGEMVGRALLDPLNVVTFGTTKVFKGVSMFKAATRAGELLPEIADVVDAEKLSKAQKVIRAVRQTANLEANEAIRAAQTVNKFVDDAGNVDRLSEAVITARKGVEAAYTAEAIHETNPLKWFKAVVAPTTSAKVQKIATEATHVLRWANEAVRAGGQELDAEEFFQAIKMAGQLASDDARQVRTAWEYLSHIGNPAPLLTEEGMRGILAINRMTEKWGGFEKALKSIQESSNGLERLGKLTEFADIRAWDIAEEMFPTLQDLAKKGKLPLSLRAVEKVDSFFKNYVQKPFNWFFGQTQLGLNPGYAVRNSVQNLVQSVFDEGVEVILGNRVAKTNESFAWMGVTRNTEGLLESTPWAKGSVVDNFIVGRNKALTAMSGFGLDKQKWWKSPFRYMSNKMEQFAGQAIFNKVIPEAMKKGLRNNVRIAMTNLGFDPETARDLEHILIRRFGDVKGTIQEAKDYVTSGVRKVLGSENLPHSLREEMNTFVGETRYNEWMVGSDTADEMVGKMREYQDYVHSNVERELKKEIVTAMQDGDLGLGNDGYVAGVVGDSVTDGTLKFEDGQTIQSAINANITVNRDIDEVLNVTQRNYMLSKYQKATDAALRDFHSQSAKITLEIPEEWGGGTMNGYEYFKGRKFGAMYDKANAELHKAIDGWILDAGSAQSREELQKIWDIAGLEKRNGALGGLTNKDVVEKLKDELFWRKQEMGQTWRDANYMMAGQFTDEMSVFAARNGAKPWHADKIMYRATKDLELAKKFDKFLPKRLVERQLRSGLAKIKQGRGFAGKQDIALAYARMYGFPVMTSSGVPLDKYIINILNKETGRTFTDLGKLENISVEEIQTALFRHSLGIAQQAIDEPAKTVGIIQKIQDGVPLTYDESMLKNHMLDILQEVDPDLRDRFGAALFQEFKTRGTDQAEEALNTLQDITDEVQQAFREVSKVPSASELVKMPDDELKAFIDKAMKFDQETGKKLGQAVYARRSLTEPNIEDVKNIPSMVDLQTRQRMVDAGVDVQNVSEEVLLRNVIYHTTAGRLEIITKDGDKVYVAGHNLYTDVIPFMNSSGVKGEMGLDAIKEINDAQTGKNIYSVANVDEVAARAAENISNADAAVKEAQKAVEDMMGQFTRSREEVNAQGLTEQLIENVVRQDNIDVPPSVWGGENAPMSARAMNENMEGFDSMIDDLEKHIRDNWDRIEVNPHAGSKEQIARLDKAEGVMKDMVEAQRRVTVRYAEQTRDFILHDYGRKRNFDLLLAYIYPYHFWYTRTYANWMQRILRNPGAVQAYLEYKDYLSQAHWDTPEWYRQNLKITGLLGMDTSHPLLANLESWVNPLYALLAPDFNDADKRDTQMGRAMDNLGKFGPSIHQAYSLAFGLYQYATGSQESGRKWMGRLTGNISRATRAATDILKIGPVEGGVELDPVQIFTALAEGRKWFQGMDPYERGRVARALFGMVDRGQITEDQSVDAIREGWGNPYFETAIAYARSNRTAGDLLSYLGSPAFRTRTPEDAEVDLIDAERSRIYKLRDTYSPEQYAAEWAKFRAKFPAADIVSMARGNPDERDTAFVYHVLNRIPAGARSEFYQRAGISYDMVQQFYDTKGDNLHTMTKDQRDEFMNGFIHLSMVMSTPDTATKQEWETAGKANQHVLDQLKQKYGEETTRKEDLYWTYYNSGDRDSAYAFLDANPDLENYMNDKTLMLNNDPLLRKYYVSFGAGKAMYNSRMYDELNKEFPDIEREQQAYYDEKAKGSKIKPSERLIAYWARKDVLLEHYNNLILSFGQTLPEGAPIKFRTDYPEEKLTQGAQDIVAAGQYNKANVPEYMSWNWADFAMHMSPTLQRVVSDWAFRGAPLSDSAESSLEYSFKDYNIPLPMLRDLMRQALTRAGAQFYSAENPPTQYTRP